MGIGIDVGYEGEPIVPSAITIDSEKPYTSTGNHPLNLRVKQESNIGL